MLIWHSLGGYGVFVVERNGTDVDDALASLQRWKDNICLSLPFQL